MVNWLMGSSMNKQQQQLAAPVKKDPELIKAQLELERKRIASLGVLTMRGGSPNNLLGR